MIRSIAQIWLVKARRQMRRTNQSIWLKSAANLLTQKLYSTDIFAKTLVISLVQFHKTYIQVDASNSIFTIFCFEQ